VEQILAKEREREFLCGETAAKCEMTEEGDALCDVGVPTQLLLTQ
jgi:hypothetical protein